MKHVLLVITLLLLAASLYLYLYAPSRYGTHKDTLPCGKNSAAVYHYTATSYFLVADAEKRSDVATGTCPYQYYEAKTFALEVWVITLISSILLYRKSQST